MIKMMCCSLTYVGLFSSAGKLVVVVCLQSCSFQPCWKAGGSYVSAVLVQFDVLHDRDDVLIPIVRGSCQLCWEAGGSCLSAVLVFSAPMESGR